MIVSRTVMLGVFSDPTQFTGTEYEHIYQKNDDGYFVTALEYALEDGEEEQYPMEDILDRFYLHIEAPTVASPEHPGSQVDLFAGSELRRVAEAIQNLVGRRARNVSVKDETGRERIALVFEEL